MPHPVVCHERIDDDELRLIYQHIDDLVQELMNLGISVIGQGKHSSCRRLPDNTDYQAPPSGAAFPIGPSWIRVVTRAGCLPGLPCS
jgi:hypothetical protein